MSITALTVISEALADLGVIRPGEVVSTTVQTDCLLRLNQRMSAHSIEQSLVQTNVHSTYNLQAGVSRYTFGVGGVFSTSTRPEKISGWKASFGFFQVGGSVLTFAQLQAQSKDGIGTTSVIPAMLGADVAYPLINIAIFPAPSAFPGLLELSYWAALSQFADLNSTNYTFPDGWDDFLHFDLAMALLPRYGRQGFDSAALAANMQTSKAKILTLIQAPGVQAAA